MSDPTDTAVHLYPVWRNRANFIIHAAISGLERGRWEQLWARQVAEDQFEICCIPFFVYNLCLGDIVQTRAVGDKLYVVSRVLVDAGRYTFRVWFGDIAEQIVRHQVMDDTEKRMNELGCELEWYSHDLLGISIEKDRVQAVDDYLWEQERMCRLVFETGRTNKPT